jgi:signal transduction histidine kinase
MFRRLPYRIQIPVGLSAAILVTAVLVTAVSARLYASKARLETLSTLDRGVVLIVAQARPLLAADDTWRMFSLLRDAAALIPGGSEGKGRIAVLDSQGRVFASSEPSLLETGRFLLGTNWRGIRMTPPENPVETQKLDMPDGAVVMMASIRSDDGQVLGHAFMEVDASAFTPDWVTLANTALIGVVLAVILLVPIGWLVGGQMTQPVARLIKAIERIGHEPPHELKASVPQTIDPELGRIGSAIIQLLNELEQREKAESRALSAERLAAVGRITAAVAHEINNPLMGLLTATQTMRIHGDSQATRIKSLDLLDRGLQQIRTTVAALLPQARIEDRPLVPGDLDDIVTLVQATADAYATHLDVNLEIESALRVPSAPMRQVMLNLLLNAIKAAGENGFVQATLNADAVNVQFLVTNSGPQLNEERFKATLDAESGLDPRGFGLWVCREFASHFRGGFELIGHPTNTTLVFWIPNQDVTKPQV